MDALPLMLVGARVIGWALLHFFWQGALLGLVHTVVRLALPRGEARYRFGMIMLIALAVCPLLTIWRLLDAAPSTLQAVAAIATPTAISHGPAIDGAWAWDASIDIVLPWLVLAWSFGVLLLSLRAWRQWQGLKVLVRMAESMPGWQGRVTGLARRFGLHRRITVLCSKVVATPVLVGWLRPVILLPMAVVCNFPATQIELILAHELAHLRRWDPIANLFQVVLETLYFYHPAVHWVSRDVRNEREICCDELALAVSGGSRREFVAALAELGELREQHGSLLLAAAGGVLLDRVQHMVVPMQTAAARAPARFVGMLLGAALVVLTLRIEWKQAELQRNLTEAIMQIRPLLTPSWLLPARSKLEWHMPDLALTHAAALRPLTEATPEADRAAPLIAPGAKVDMAMLPVSLRTSDLPLIRDEAPVRIVEQASSSTMPAVAPTPIRIRQPIYPQSALMRGIEGQVVVEFGLATDGSVEDLRVVRAEPAGLFDQAAIHAMRSWKYALPADGTVQRRYRQTMAFVLHAAGRGGATEAHAGSGEIQAVAGCQIVTGTHICRWPDDAGPRAGGTADLSLWH